VIFKPRKTFISQHIHLHWYNCFIALPVRRSQQRRSTMSLLPSQCNSISYIQYILLFLSQHVSASVGHLQVLALTPKPLYCIEWLFPSHTVALLHRHTLKLFFVKQFVFNFFFKISFSKIFSSLKLLFLFLFKLVPYLGVVHLLQSCMRSPYVYCCSQFL
jgi:hypothetical protein